MDWAESGSQPMKTRLFIDHIINIVSIPDYINYFFRNKVQGFRLISFLYQVNCKSMRICGKSSFGSDGD